MCVCVCVCVCVYVCVCMCVCVCVCGRGIRLDRILLYPLDTKLSESPRCVSLGGSSLQRFIQIPFSLLCFSLLILPVR